jgi:hypothetical protein
MLLITAAVLGLAVFGFALVAQLARMAMGRLGLRPISVLLFFGLAEAPADELSIRRTATASR